LDWGAVAAATWLTRTLEKTSQFQSSHVAILFDISRLEEHFCCSGGVAAYRSSEDESPETQKGARMKNKLMIVIGLGVALLVGGAVQAEEQDE